MSARVGGVPSSVATTRLVPPKHGAPLLRRDALLQTLMRERHRVLITVTAPAGFGKTTLLAQWRRELIQSGCCVAWLALERHDDSDLQLVTGLSASLERAGLDAGRAALEVAHRTLEQRPELVAGVLINELAERPEEIYLLLDDAHHLRDSAAIRLLQHLIDHAPENLHVTLSARAAVPLKLARLRLREQLGTVELHHLRFTLEEARTFLRSRVPETSPEVLHALHRATDGWVAGLQLASIALRNRRTAATEMPAGGDGVAAYFAEQILDTLPGELLDFLLRISVCDRFNAALCAAVTGLQGAEAMLRRIEQENLFVLPVEAAENWYRFHPLFAEYLHRRLRSHPSIDPIALHRRASAWLRQAGLMVEATRHALEAGDTTTALEMIARSSRNLIERGHYKTLVHWAERLPRDALHRGGPLATNTAFAMAMCFRFDDAEHLLAQASQRAPDPADFDPRAVRGIIALFRDDCARVLAELPQWLAEANCDDPLQIGAACNVLTCAYVQSGRLQAARDAQIPARRWPDERRSPAELVYSRCVTGLTWATAGDTDRADTYYREALSLAEQRVGRRSLPAAFAAALYAEILYETGRLDALESVLEERLDLVLEAAIPEALQRGFVSFARNLHARDDATGALGELERLQGRALALGLRRPHAVALAERIRVALARGDRVCAESLQDELESLAAAGGSTQYGDAVRLEADISRARVLLTEGKASAAGGIPRLLGPHLGRAERLGLGPLTVRLRLLVAVALAQSARPAEAESALHEALRGAASASLLRAFADEPRALKLLESAYNDRRARADGIAPGFVERVTAAARVAGAADPHGTAAEPARPLLSEREREILALLGRGFSNKKIALTLDLSAETVKWHLKRIYPKLGVGARGQAVDCARARGLL